MSGNWSKGSTPAWRRIRARVLLDNQLNNGGRCTIRIQGICTGEATQVHHILGREVTGDDPKYLTASCGPCNGHIGSPSKHQGPKHRRISSW